MRQPQILRQKSLPPDELTGLDDLHEYSVALARKHFDKKVKRADKNPILLWVVRIPIGVAHLKTEWTDDFEKDRTAQFMRLLMQESAALAYSFISEVWIALDEADASGKWKGVLPSERPTSEREDALMVTTYKRGELTDYRATRFGCVLPRYDAKRWRLLERDDYHADPSMRILSGRFFNLINQSEIVIQTGPQHWKANPA